MCSWFILPLFHFVLFTSHFTIGLKSVEGENSVTPEVFLSVCKWKGHKLQRQGRGEGACGPVTEVAR